MHLIWVKPETKYFCKWGWTSYFGKPEVICPSGSFASDARDYFAVMAAMKSPQATVEATVRT
jgi:hypothetical protein